jgi:hypothetical protein
VSWAAAKLVLEGNGQELREAGLDAIARAGGWQVVTGISTIMRVFLWGVMDSMIDCYALGYGWVDQETLWTKTLEEYLGERIAPRKIVWRDGGMEPRMLVAGKRHKAVCRAQQDANAAAVVVMDMACCDLSIMRMKRYRCDTRAFRLYRARHASTEK